MRYLVISKVIQRRSGYVVCLITATELVLSEFTFSTKLRVFSTYIYKYLVHLLRAAYTDDRTVAKVKSSKAVKPYLWPLIRASARGLSAAVVSWEGTATSSS